MNTLSDSKDASVMFYHARIMHDPPCAAVSEPPTLNSMRLLMTMSPVVMIVTILEMGSITSTSTGSDTTSLK